MGIFTRKVPATKPATRSELSGSFVMLRDKLTEVLSGLGGMTDRVSKVRYQAPEPVGRLEIESAYEFDGIIERYITRPVEDSLAKGVDFPGLDAEEISALNQFLESSKIDMWQQIERAWCTMRMNHGAAIWVDTGATDNAMPMQESESVRRLVVFDSEMLWGIDINRFSEPELWATGDPSAPKLIHRSRLLMFPGRFVSPEYREKKLGWGAREIDKIWDAWIHFKITYLMPANIAMTFEEGVISLQGLNNQMTSEQGRSVVQAKLFDLEGIRSFLRLRVQDANDKFERHGSPVTGLEGIMDIAKRYFVTVTGWPHTIILGEGPGSGLAGSNAGKSEKEDWQRIISAEQERYLRRPLRQFLEIIAPELRKMHRKPFKDLRFNFPSMLAESPADKADRQLKEAQRDKIYGEDLAAVDNDELREDLVKREVYNLDLMSRPQYEAE